MPRTMQRCAVSLDSWLSHLFLSSSYITGDRRPTTGFRPKAVALAAYQPKITFSPPPGELHPGLGREHRGLHGDYTQPVCSAPALTPCDQHCYWGLTVNTSV